LNLTEAQIRAEDATSERVVFNCSGCGRETIIHVGRDSYLLEKQCSRCVGSDRVRPFMPAPVKGQRTGTHGGRRVVNPELRERRRAKSQRAKSSRMGVPARKPCADYGCEGHRRHSTKSPASGGKKW
jgi:hypothetical protein